MNILLTGGSGFIGSHACLSFIQAGHRVTIYDNLSNSKENVISRIKKITGKNIAFIKGDILNQQMLSKAISDNKIESVIHFAGLKSVSDSIKNPLDYFDNNVAGTLSVLKAMEQNNIKKIIFSSSATVYGVPEYLPIDEDHKLEPINPYGVGKKIIEDMLKDIALSDSDWGILCLRYFNPVGAHESALIGEDSTGIPSNLVPYITSVAMGKYKSVNIFGNDYPTSDGTGIRDYIHVMDLADGHLSALEYFCSGGKGFEAVNLGTGKGVSVLEVINEFSCICKNEIPFVIRDRRPGDVASSFASVNKAFSLLNWQAKYNLYDMCKSSLDWAKNIQ